MSPLFATGAAPQRSIRSSRLLFGWQSRHLTLDAYTGQPGTFAVYQGPATYAQAVVGRNGADIVAGVGMPRWEQEVSTRGETPRLLLEGEVAGQVVEQVSYPWPLRVMAMSAYVRIWPYYVAGSTLAAAAYALTFGTSDSEGGRLALRRDGATWNAFRERQGVTLSTGFTEPAGTVYPIDLLITLSAVGGLTILGRSAANPPVLFSSATVTNAAMMTATDYWADNTLAFNGTMGLAAPGGRWRYETVKVARGIQTLTSMDGLS